MGSDSDDSDSLYIESFHTFDGNESRNQSQKRFLEETFGSQCDESITNTSICNSKQDKSNSDILHDTVYEMDVEDEDIVRIRKIKRKYKIKKKPVIIPREINTEDVEELPDLNVECGKKNQSVIEELGMEPESILNMSQDILDDLKKAKLNNS